MNSLSFYDSIPLYESIGRKAGRLPKNGSVGRAGNSTTNLNGSQAQLQAQIQGQTPIPPPPPPLPTQTSVEDPRINGINLNLDNSGSDLNLQPGDGPYWVHIAETEATGTESDLEGQVYTGLERATPPPPPGAPPQHQNYSVQLKSEKPGDIYTHV
jgi:hypothetical protein